MQYLTAARIHDGYRFLPNDSVLIIANDGTILDIVAKNTIANKQIDYFEGLLCPGFVNTHCHLELSHLRGVIPEATGLVDFVRAIPAVRNDFDEADILSAIQKQLVAMQQNGIVAVGDIANTAATLPIRNNSPIHIHTFIESMGFVPSTAPNRFAYSTQLFDQFFNAAYNSKGKIMSQSIVPHAPYSVTPALANYIDTWPDNIILSFHNQESFAETAFFKDKMGDMQRLYQSLGIDVSYFQPPNQSSLTYFLSLFKQVHQYILVHNTFTTSDDLAWLQQSDLNVYMCLCPQANWYIERKLPDIAMLSGSQLPICLGTDSLASNYNLSILAEIQLIKSHYPAISLETLLQWATMNGAKALGMQHVIGSFEAGKKPGIINVQPKGSIMVIA